MKTSIYLIRHGEVYNPKNLLYGRLAGFGLSEKGKEQAQKLGKHLKSQKISHMYASPLLRAQETAKLAALHLGIETINEDARLIEVGNPFEGMPNTKYYSEIGTVYDKKYYRAGAETPQQLKERMHEFLHDVVKKHGEQTILAVSHGDPITALYASYVGEPLTTETFHKHLVSHTHGIQFEFDGAKLQNITKFSY